MSVDKCRLDGGRSIKERLRLVDVPKLVRQQLNRSPYIRGIKNYVVLALRNLVGRPEIALVYDARANRPHGAGEVIFVGSRVLGGRKVDLCVGYQQVLKFTDKSRRVGIQIGRYGHAIGTVSDERSLRVLGSGGFF